MMLNKDIEDLTIITYARRKLRQPLSDLFALMLLLILGSGIVEDVFQVIEALKLLNFAESRASVGVQLEDGECLFEGILGRIDRGIGLCI
jgi:hypothetical protein